MPNIPIHPDHMAFPCANPNGEPGMFGSGLTKKEYFAALTLQGILANPNIPQTLKENSYSMLAIHAVKAADALIVALNQEE